MIEPPDTPGPFSGEIREAIVREASDEELVRIVRAHKNLGLTKSAALQALATLRSSVTDPQEDRILDLMDIVSGWCAPDQRIYPEANET
jgi:hypothetical protein